MGFVGSVEDWAIYGELVMVFCEKVNAETSVGYLVSIAKENLEIFQLNGF